jgi:capsular polysaccharide biosynthesis protein
MKRVVRDLEAKLKAEESAVPPPTGASSGGGGNPRGRTLSPEEVAAQRKLQDTRQELAAVEGQIATKQAEERRLREQIGQFQHRVAMTPSIEAEFTALTRDYETLQSQYQSLLTKNEDSKVAAALERRQIGEQFRVLDRARLPEAPFSPNRLLINLGGIFGGLAVGFGLVMLLETRDKTVRTEADLGRVVDVPVLASIPVIGTNEDRRRGRRTRLLAALAAGLFFIIMVAGAAYAYKAGLLHAPLWMR